MEVSDVRRRVIETLERARRNAAERRVHVDQAAREWPAWLDQVAVPLFRQCANVLKVENHAFTVFTPSGSVRLASDRSPDDFVELLLDAAGDRPLVLGHARRARGGRILETERVVGEGSVRDVTEEQVLSFLLEEVERLVQR